MTISPQMINISIKRLAFQGGILLLCLLLPGFIYAQSEGATGIYYESLTAKNRLKLARVDEDEGYFENVRLHLSTLSGKMHQSIIDNISWGVGVGAVRAIGTSGNTKFTTSGPLAGVELLFGQLTELAFGYEMGVLEDVIFTSVHPITGEHRFYRTSGNFTSMSSSLGLAFEMTEKSLIKFYISQKQAEMTFDDAQISGLSTMYNGAGLSFKILL